VFHAKIPVGDVLLVHSVFSPRISLGGSCDTRGDGSSATKFSTRSVSCGSALSSVR